jgi:hypothetical protein
MAAGRPAGYENFDSLTEAMMDRGYNLNRGKGLSKSMPKRGGCARIALSEAWSRSVQTQPVWCRSDATADLPLPQVKSDWLVI